MDPPRKPNLTLDMTLLSDIDSHHPSHSLSPLTVPHQRDNRPPKHKVNFKIPAAYGLSQTSQDKSLFRSAPYFQARYDRAVSPGSTYGKYHRSPRESLMELGRGLSRAGSEVEDKSKDEDPGKDAKIKYHYRFQEQEELHVVGEQRGHNTSTAREPQDDVLDRQGTIAVLRQHEMDHGILGKSLME